MTSIPPPLRESNDQTFANYENDEAWPNWREETRQLDYDDRDIRVIFERTEGSLSHSYEPPIFGDFDPQPDDPDPDVWPVTECDPGTAPVEDLVKITKTFPAPHVAWVTPKYIEHNYGNVKTSVTLEARSIPKSLRPDDLHPDDEVTVSAADSSLTLTDDHLTFFDRLARLWNGKGVRGQHLLLDKCPDWGALFGDLNQDDLADLFVDPNGTDSVAEAFPDHDWVETGSVFLRCQRILRKKVWYAPTLRARKLINSRDDLPDLNGDPKEGLRHRVTVGLARLYEAAAAAHDESVDEYSIFPYFPYDGFIIDLLVDRGDTDLYFEVITDHNNWELHRETYRKLSELRSHGTPIAVFDSRQTAYKVMNHWHRAGCGELPSGPFDSNPRISWGRKKINEAYHDDDLDWDISDWMTTATLWRNTLGQDGLDIDRTEFIPHIW